MAAANPYAPPQAELRSRTRADVFDDTRPLSPRGRFGRITWLYWSFAFLLLLNVASSMISLALTSLLAEASQATLQYVDLALGSLFLICLLILQAIAAIRRLHDIGLSGATVMVLFVPVLNLLLLLGLALVRGNPDANRFGPPAKPWTGFQLFVVIIFLLLFSFAMGVGLMAFVTGT